MAAFAVPPIFDISIFVKTSVKPEVITKTQKNIGKTFQEGFCKSNTCFLLVAYVNLEFSHFLIISD